MVNYDETALKNSETFDYRIEYEKIKKELIKLREEDSQKNIKQLRDDVNSFALKRLINILKI